MIKLGTSIKTNKNLLRILIIFLIVGFLISFLLYTKLDIKSTISVAEHIDEYLTNNINYLFYHFLLISVMLMCSFTIIGLIIFPIYFLYELICIYYSIFIFGKVYHLPGIIYGILYNTLTKIIFLILLFLLFKKVLNILKYILKKSLNLEEKIADYSIIKNFKHILLIIIAILLNDFFIYLFSSKILLKLIFIIK